MNVTGEWVADLTFVSADRAHHFTIEQNDGQLSGMHRGDILSGKLTGAVEGRRVTIRSHAAHRRRDVALRILGRCERAAAWKAS